MTILIVAGNYQEFKDYCLQNKINPLLNKKIKYVLDIECLYGICDCIFIYYGTYRRRKDYWDIKKRQYEMEF